MTLIQAAADPSKPSRFNRRRAARVASETTRIDSMSRWLWTTCAAAIVVGIVVSLHFYLHRGSLWEDELIAITHANQPLPSFFIEVLRNDIHPPIYFLQLAAWLAIGPDSDGWALANSLLWAASSLVTIFVVARSIDGTRGAWIAAALFAVLPNTDWSAGTLRMYAALPACVLLVYYANRRWFETRSGSWLARALVVEVVTGYLHAVEFYFIAFVVAGALAEAMHAGRLRIPSLRFTRSVRMWLLVQVVFGLCMLPLLASALVRGSDAAAPDSAAALLTIGGTLLAGWKASSLLWVRLAGTVLFVILLAAGLIERSSRWRTLMIPVGAIVVATLIGLLLKPIFKQPIFAANLLPFVVLGAAAAASRSRKATGFAVVCIVVLAVAAWPLSPREAQPEPFAAAARSVRERAVDGDVVVVPNVSVYWGIVRYAIGPRWGRPLAVMPAPNDEWSRLNQRIAKSLGADAPRRLGLVPERDFVIANGVRYVLGNDVLAATQDARHVWLVTRDRYRADIRLDPRLQPSEVVGPESYGDGELLVRRFDRPDAP